MFRVSTFKFNCMLVASNSFFFSRLYHFLLDNIQTCPLSQGSGQHSWYSNYATGWMVWGTNASRGERPLFSKNVMTSSAA